MTNQSELRHKTLKIRKPNKNAASQSAYFTQQNEEKDFKLKASYLFTEGQHNDSNRNE